MILETKPNSSPSGKGQVFEVTADPSTSTISDTMNRKVEGGKKKISISFDMILEWQRKMKHFEEKFDDVYTKAIRREHLISIESSIDEVKSILLDYLNTK